MSSLPLKIISFFANKFFYPLRLLLHKISLGLMWFWYVHKSEDNLLKQLKKYYWKKHIIFFDVWFNVGSYSELVFNAFGDKVEIYWFEPVKKTYETWLHNIRHIHNKKIFNFGLWEKEIEQSIYLEDDLSWCASLYWNINTEGSLKSEVISIKTLDDICQKNHISYINFLKIDVEWFELSVLNGWKNILNSWSIDMIQFEFYKTNVFSKVFFYDFWKLLHENYKIYRILNNSLFEIKEYNHVNCEIFIGVNYLAVKKDISFTY